MITEDPFGEGGAARPGQSGALAVLLRHGSYATPFLDTVARGVYDYEREAGASGGPVWKPRSLLGSDYLGAFTADNREAYDPLASIMIGLGNNPQAAQHFFAGGDGARAKLHDVEVTVPERLRYLLTQRRWPTDDGDGLGLALQAATTTWRGQNDAPGSRDRLSAEIASQTIALLGDKIGDGDDWRDDGFQIPEGMRDSVAAILASYISDVFWASIADDEDAVGDDGTWHVNRATDGWPTDLPIGMRLNSQGAALVLQSLGRSEDKEAASTVIAAGLQFQTDLTEYAVTEIRKNTPPTLRALRDSDDRSLLEKAGITTGVSMNFLVVNAFQGGKDQNALTVANRQRLAWLFTAGSSLAPTPPGRVGGLLFNEAKSYVSDQLGNTSDDALNAWAEETDEHITRSLEFQLYNALLRHGFLTGGQPGTTVLPEIAIERDEQGLPRIKPYLWDPGDPDRRNATREERDAYNKWIVTLRGSPRDLVDPYFIAPYKDGFKPNYG